MTSRQSLLIIVFSFFPLLWIGIWHDPEFDEPNIFLKHQPSLKISFNTPVGESDLTLDDLPPGKYEEEKAYIDFVSSRWRMVQLTQIPALLLHVLGLGGVLLGIMGLFGQTKNGIFKPVVIALMVGLGIAVGTYYCLITELVNANLWGLLSIGLSALFAILISFRSLIYRPIG